MATSIIRELQGLAAETGNVSELLRKAFIVAVKLRLDEFRKWINLELNGYVGDEVLPAYRVLPASVHAWNPVRGWIPIIFQEDGPLYRFVSSARMGKSIGEIDELLKSDSTFFVSKFAPKIAAILMSEQRLPMEPSQHISRSGLASILDAVRNTILDWSLKLEEEGIIGDGMTFSDSEKEKAAATDAVHVRTFINMVGNGNKAYADSTDNSVSYLSMPSVLNDVRKHIQEHAKGHEQTELLQKIDDLEGATTRSAGMKKFSDFVGFAANLSTVWNFVAPYVPKIQHLIASLPQ
ncbi:MAG TPA: hypothetical protein VHQ47_00685 [Phycisphaerae bacterium]|jgi:hypothetical protein|nr:hypothetical protein [Phycisphaerae bacterium]